MLVVALWRYPVASFAGEICSSAVAEEHGLRGDRSFVAIRTDDGMVAAPERDAAWRNAPLVEARGDPVRIRTPDGSWHEIDDDAVESALSAHFGFGVQLKRSRPFNRPDPSGLGVPVRGPRQPLHLITTWQFDELRAALPDSRVELARFRPNLLLEASEAETERLRQAPVRLRVGECVLAVVEETTRCGFPALAQAGLPHDGKIVKHLVRTHRLKFGFGCRVLHPGHLRENDDVTW